VFQQFNLFPHLSALENIMLAQRVVRKRQAGAAEAIAHDLLLGRHPRKGRQLPGNCPAAATAHRHRARVGHAAKIMLFDEPRRRSTRK
jgi:polar amino acid transport system ATP-binding protein